MLPAERRPDPTPDEIEQRAAEVRSEWSEEQHYQRHWMKFEPIEIGVTRVSQSIRSES